MNMLIGFLLGTAVFWLGWFTGRRQGRLDEKLSRLKEPAPYSVGLERAKAEWREKWSDRNVTVREVLLDIAKEADK